MIFTEDLLHIKKKSATLAARKTKALKFKREREDICVCICKCKSLNI